MNNYIKDEDCCVSLGDEHTKGIRPTISHGYHGLISSGDEYILFEEDDGHYWNVMSLSKTELAQLKIGLRELQSNLSSKKEDLLHFRFKTGIPKIKSKLFNLHYDIENYILNRIKITINGVDIDLHPCYLKGLLDCLYLKEYD